MEIQAGEMFMQFAEDFTISYAFPHQSWKPRMSLLDHCFFYKVMVLLVEEIQLISWGW